MSMEVANPPLTELLNFSNVENMNAILKVNSRGTMTLPKKLRTALGVGDGGTLMCSYQGCDVVLQPTKIYPIEMYTDERIAEFDQADREIGDVDKLFEMEGLVYDPKTWSLHEKKEKTPYMKRKKKKA